MDIDIAQEYCEICGAKINDDGTVDFCAGENCGLEMFDVLSSSTQALNFRDKGTADQAYDLSGTRDLEKAVDSRYELKSGFSVVDDYE